jgi:hypothetical protein
VKDCKIQQLAREVMNSRRKDTICPTHVAAMVSTAMIEPRRLSWRSVTDAIPTPKSRTMREALMLWLKGSSSCQKKKFTTWNGTGASQIRHWAESGNDLNFLLRKRVSKTMVKGMMASLVICCTKER